MAQGRRRVSYIIPPTDNVPHLQLPPLGIARLGSTGPLLLRSEDGPQDQAPKSKHPRHRLGIASLALDTSTQLVGKDAPEGILYSGGRDGLVMSWDLGVPMKRKDDVVGQRSRGRWESLTGWEEEGTDDELDEEDEHPISDGDILGDVSRRRRPSSTPDMPRWETDSTAYQPGTAAQFRQCAQVHTDWVNDILLCNYHQTLVSASSDGTIKAWNPHAVVPTDPTTMGSHTDYVRCLASCRDQNWVASGSFDRTIKLWDLGRPTGSPLVTMNPPDAAPKSSVYALTADPFGRVVASGSPERVVRLWDPRTGKRTGKLVGHTDNIRAILISEDSKYLLTGSADASVKLWSLSSQRCLHTFAHHTDSVWSLFSDHPSLEVFYSGDRSGLVCRVDVEDCGDLSEGECVLLCNDSGDATQPSVSEGINKIAVMDDNLLWTASGVSTLKRWNIPQRRKVRKPAVVESPGEGERLASASFFRRKLPMPPDGSPELNTRSPLGRESSPLVSPSLHSVTSDPEREQDPESKLNGLPYDSLIKLISSNDPFTPYTSPTRARDPEVATLYSAASIMSVPRHNARSPQQGTFPSNPMMAQMHSSRTEDTVMVINTSRAMYEDREVAADAIPFCSEPEFVIPGDHGLVRSIILNDRVNALTVDTAGEVAVWDIVRGVCLGKYPPEVVAAASHSGSEAGGSGEKERSPREALEAVRERIEGEAVVSSWCSADTKAGVLTIHMMERCFDAEVYADEVGYAGSKHFNDESKLNIGKWVLRNLFNDFIKEELRLHPEKGQPVNLSRTSSQETLDQTKRLVPTPSRESMKRHFRHSSTSTAVVSSSSLIPAIPPNVPAVARSSPLLTPLIPLHANRDVSILPPIPQSPAAHLDATPMAAHVRSRSGVQDSVTTPTAASSQGKEDYFSPNRVKQTPTLAVTPGSPEDFSGWTGPAKTEPMTPSTPTGIMGRLRSFGKPKRPASDAANAAALLTPTAEVIPEEKVEEVKTPLQQLLSGKLEPPSTTEAPLYRLPSGTTILISEEAQPSYMTVYRGTAGHLSKDIEALEASMPMWLVEYLLLNQVPPTAPLAKLSFVLMPWNKDPDVEPLPEMLNTQQSKLTASRYLRVRKIVNHVQDKLEKLMSGSGAPSLRSFVDGQDQGRSQHRMRAEDEYEILCNDTLLPLGMSLAAVRQFVWKSSAELVMHYRKKRMQLHPGHSA